MKKALHLAVALFFITATAQAQVTKGKILVGGTIGYAQVSEENTDNNSSPTKQNYFIINPSVGNVIKENLVLGIEATISSINQKYEAPSFEAKNESRSYGGSLFVRRYVPLLKNFYFFGQAAAGYSRSKTVQTYNNETYGKSQGWGAGINLYPGLAYAITKKFHVEAGLNNLAVIGYNHLNSENTNLNTEVVTLSESSSFNVSTSLGSNGGFSIGFRFLL